ncbi:chaplin [Streptomyces sp. NPDC047097]|uniref:chaplin n=1 Tax=Streptomyces sp. NPDC047097 TaxID=3155260 RepID=UPI0033C706AF
MRHTRRNTLVTLAATGGALAMAAGYAHADSDASGVAANSPGAVSGNAVQLPVDLPVSVCGNTINVVGLLNPAFGNGCANKGGDGNSHKDKPGTAHGKPGTQGGQSGTHNGGGNGSSAEGATTNSPGLISGNGIQLPVDLPVNVSGNSVGVVGILNPVFGNASSNGGDRTPPTPTPQKPKPPQHEEEEPTTPPTPDEAVPVPHPAPEADKPAPQPETETAAQPELAETGASAGLLGVGAPAALGLALGGAVLYRRFRPTAGARA